MKPVPYCGFDNTDLGQWGLCTCRNIKGQYFASIVSNELGLQVIALVIGPWRSYLCNEELYFLCFQLYYHSGTLLTYIGLKHDGEVNSKIVEGSWGEKIKLGTVFFISSWQGNKNCNKTGMVNQGKYVKFVLFDLLDTNSFLRIVLKKVTHQWPNLSSITTGVLKIALDCKIWHFASLWSGVLKRKMMMYSVVVNTFCLL